MKAPRQLTSSEAYADSPTEASALWDRGFRPCHAEEVQQGDRIAYVVTDPFRLGRAEGSEVQTAAVFGVEVEPQSCCVTVEHSGGVTEADSFDEVWRVAGGAKNDLTDEGW